ncbi:MAG: aldehyde dehydrogenase family protein, partial [Bacteroidota bacterium]
MTLPHDMQEVLDTLGIQSTNPSYSTGQQFGSIDTGGQTCNIHSPVDGSLIASVQMASEAHYNQVIEQAQTAFKIWRMIPAPQRGEIVRQIGNRLRQYKEPLGKLVTYEMGKIYQEGLGEVQEMIDICDFAVGQSRQLYGFTMHSERPQHRMYDQYHPLGIVGIIS